MSLLSEDSLIHLVETYGPGLVGVLTCLEAMGLPLPAESLLIATAIYAGTTHKVAILWIVVSATIGAIVGDNIGFWVGRTLGWRALRRWGRHVGLTEDRLTVGAYLFRRHGAKVVFFGRFIVILRTFAALLAGANRMDWARFLPANAAGGVVWACGYGLAAYWFGKKITDLEGPAAIVFGVIGVAVVVTLIVLTRRNEASLVERAKHEMGQTAR